MISGIFENCVGSKDIEATLKYWAEFGYREVNRGELWAEQAGLLYGHESDWEQREKVRSGFNSQKRIAS